MGNRHRNVRRPDGPPCPYCGAPWRPVCRTRYCPAREVSRNLRGVTMARTSRYYGVEGERRRRQTLTAPLTELDYITRHPLWEQRLRETGGLRRAGYDDRKLSPNQARGALEAGSRRDHDRAAA